MAMLTEVQEKRRQELIAMKAKNELTNQGLADVLPDGVGTKKAVDYWTCGHRPIPIATMVILRHVLEGTKIKGKT